MTRNECLELLLAAGVDIQKEGCVLVGLRTKTIGTFNDKLVWIGRDGEYQEFVANTDPSRYYNRVATLVGDKVYRYKIGKHGYGRATPPYDAFRQAGEVEVDRYIDGKIWKRDKGIFAINIHRGGANTTSSAGCQTLPPATWEEFRYYGYKLLKRYGRQDNFAYYLKNVA